MADSDSVVTVTEEQAKAEDLYASLIDQLQKDDDLGFYYNYDNYDAKEKKWRDSITPHFYQFLMYASSPTELSFEYFAKNFDLDFPEEVKLDQQERETLIYPTYTAVVDLYSSKPPVLKKFTIKDAEDWFSMSDLQREGLATVNAAMLKPVKPANADENFAFTTVLYAMTRQALIEAEAQEEENAPETASEAGQKRKHDSKQEGSNKKQKAVLNEVERQMLSLILEDTWKGLAFPLRQFLSRNGGMSNKDIVKTPPFLGLYSALVYAGARNYPTEAALDLVKMDDEDLQPYFANAKEDVIEIREQAEQQYGPTCALVSINNLLGQTGLIKMENVRAAKEACMLAIKEQLIAKKIPKTVAGKALVAAIDSLGSSPEAAVEHEAAAQLIGKYLEEAAGVPFHTEDSDATARNIYGMYVFTGIVPWFTELLLVQVGYCQIPLWSYTLGGKTTKLPLIDDIDYAHGKLLVSVLSQKGKGHVVAIRDGSYMDSNYSHLEGISLLKKLLNGEGIPGTYNRETNDPMDVALVRRVIKLEERQPYLDGRDAIRIDYNQLHDPEALRLTDTIKLQKIIDVTRYYVNTAFNETFVGYNSPLDLWRHYQQSKTGVGASGSGANNSALSDEGSTRAWRKIREEVLERDHYKCAYCGKRANTVDHVKPRSAGGDDTLSNLVAACGSCNQRKAAEGGAGIDTAERARETLRDRGVESKKVEVQEVGMYLGPDGRIHEKNEDGTTAVHGNEQDEEDAEAWEKKKQEEVSAKRDKNEQDWNAAQDRKNGVAEGTTSGFHKFSDAAINAATKVVDYAASKVPIVGSVWNAVKPGASGSLTDRLKTMGKNLAGEAAGAVTNAIVPGSGTLATAATDAVLSGAGGLHIHDARNSRRVLCRRC